MASRSMPFQRAIASTRAGGLFKILICASSLGMMARPSGELAIAHGAKLPAQCLLGDADPAHFPDSLAKIHDAPAHHAMNRWDPATFEVAFSEARCLSAKSES